MKKWGVRWIVTGWMLLSVAAWAGEVAENNGKNVPVLETVVVTAGRVEEKKTDVATNITVVTEEQIKELSAHDLGNVLAQQGFMIREYINSLATTKIRGFSTDTYGEELNGYVLILIDGRRSGTGDLTKINVDNIERVEIIHGPGSVQYGASAAGGVVNVITKKGNGKPTLFAEGTLGSWGYHKTGAGASGQFKALDFSLSASTESQDDYDTAQGETYHNSGFDAKDRVSMNAGWTFMTNQRVGLTYTDYQGDGIGNPGYLSQNDLDDYGNHSLHSVDAVYDGQTDGGAFLWKLRYFDGKEEYETYDPKFYGDMPSYFRETDQRGAQAQLTGKWTHVDVTAGFDWLNYEITNTYSTGENTYDSPAAFLLVKTKLLDEKLILSLGGRHDWYSIESDQNQRIDETNWSTSLGAVYKITPAWRVRANYAEAFKMPTPDQLFMYNDYGPIWGIWAGNPDLAPETSQTYEIGMEFSRRSFSAGVTYFYTDFTDKIAYAYDAADNLTRYKNVEGATIAGIEGTLDFDIGALFDWTYELAPYATFTHLMEYWNEEADEDIQYTPEWTTSCGLRLANRNIGFVSRLNITHTSKQDITDYEGTGETTLGSYTVADLTISKTLFAFGKYGDVSIKADIRNLFDEDYATIQGYPMPGRSFYVGLKYTY